MLKGHTVRSIFWLSVVKKTFEYQITSVYALRITSDSHVNCIGQPINVEGHLCILLMKITTSKYCIVQTLVVLFFFLIRPCTTLRRFERISRISDAVTYVRNKCCRASGQHVTQPRRDATLKLLRNWVAAESARKSWKGNECLLFWHIQHVGLLDETSKQV